MASEIRLRRLMDRYRELVERNAPSIDLARLEKEIWAIVKVNRDVALRRRIWFAEVFGGNTVYYENRWHIFRKKWARPLFDEVDSKRMTWKSAITAYRRSNFLARRHGMKPGKVLKRVMEQYDGTTKSVENAVVDGEVVLDVSDGRESLNLLAKELRAKVKHAAEVYVAAALDKMGVEDDQHQKIIEDFVISMDQVVNELLMTIRVCRKNAKEEGLAKIGLRSFDWACEVLGIQASFGEEVDLKLVGKVVRRRARDLHPDRNKTPQAKQEYDNVNRAHEILLAYSRFRRKGNGNGITQKENTQSP